MNVLMAIVTDVPVTFLSLCLRLKALYLIEVSTLGPSNINPNGRTLTNITSDNGYKGIHLDVHFIVMFLILDSNILVSEQSNCHLLRRDEWLVGEVILYIFKQINDYFISIVDECNGDLNNVRWVFDRKNLLPNRK